MPTPTAGFSVTLPGADDIYDLIPDSARDPTERAARRSDRARRLAESPTPEIARDVQGILTTIDDVQDGLVTLSLLTRFAVPQVRALAPFAKAISTAADITNLGRAMQNLGLVGGGWKSALYRQLATQPGTYSSRLRRTLRTSKVNPTIGELLQVLQTTDALFGTGIKLGAVMGLPLDLLSLAIQGGTLNVPASSLLELATLAPAFLGASPWLSLAGLAAGFTLSALPALSDQTLSIPVPALLPTISDLATHTLEAPFAIPTITALGTAEQILEDTSSLDDLGQELTPNEHAMLALARYQALAILAPWAAASPTGLLIPDKAHLPQRRTPTPAPPLRWLTEYPTDPHAIATAALIGQATNALALMLEGNGAIEPPTWTPHALAVARAVEFSTPVPSP